MSNRAPYLAHPAIRALAVIGSIHAIDPTVADSAQSANLSPIQAQTVHLASELPQPVKHAARAALRLQFGPDTYGSGVKVGSDLVYGPGHTARDQLSGTTAGCSVSYATNARSTPHQRDQITDWLVFAADGDKPTSHDDRVLLRIKRSRSFDQLPVIKPVDDLPRVGTVGYFVNFGSEVPGTSRWPNQAQATAAGLSKRFGRPAEFAGVVTGRQGALLKVVTGLRAYGAPVGRRINVDPGGSGGPFFSAGGRLLGLDAGSVSLVYAKTAGQIWQETGQKLPIAASTVLTTELIQPITTGMLNQDRRTLPHGSEC